MKILRISLWALVVLVGGWAGYLALNKAGPEAVPAFGAEFELQATNGESLTQDDMLGRPHLVFFGFTHCPEVCPTTLYEISGWMEEIGDPAKALDIYFVSVDPERDNQEVLTNYLSPFGPQVIGLTGSAEEIDKAAKGYHVYYKKVPLEDGDYTMDHTARIALMKPDGSLMSTIAWDENSDTAVQKLKNLLKR
ncbi:MAG: SCO family protein [Salaquimonas sp.]